ncbi:MAG: acyltransferase [Phycisphaerae bacterium]|jgi:acetyltransferase-like isoleucine patch superfamily enzyme
MLRVIAYTWFAFVVAMTGFLPDVKPVLKLRGFLVRWCFRSCGRNFQVARRVEVLFSTRIDLGHDVYLAPGCWIQGVGGITLDDQVMLGPYTILATNNHTKQDGSYRFGEGSTAPITLKRGAWTGGHVVITAGMTVGAGAAVAAGAVVTKDVPDHVVVAGVPARVIASDAPAPS